MTAQEVTAISQQLRERITTILTSDQLAIYDAYRERLLSAPTTAMPEEQQVLDIIANDRQAATLDQQLKILLRVVIPPQ